MLLSFTYNLVSPVAAWALTTGPSQPEVQGFEPVGTTDMVDMFTGDFNYNIPLMDVEGYPINIAYHGGVGMEQEASWVGLGWSLNPGVINRNLRGVPDDFNGEQLKKELNIKKETTTRAGIQIGGEVVGAGDPLLSLNASLGSYVNFSNYSGVSVDFDLGVGLNLMRSASVGVNLGVGSQSGADFDYNASVSYSGRSMSGDIAGGLGIGVGGGYNSRNGVKDMAFTLSPSLNVSGARVGPTMTATVPIALKNYVPVITNSSRMQTYSGRLKLGIEGFWLLGYGAASGMHSEITYDQDGSRNAYGYMYAENAGDSDIHDFTRDKDGSFNKTMSNLPMPSATYDVYSISGQGTGGAYRPFRNDIGSVYDPAMESGSSGFAANAEAGAPYIFEVGVDITMTNTSVKSGPWNKYKRPYQRETTGSTYEKFYLKKAGETTASDRGYYNQIGADKPLSVGETEALPLKRSGSRAPRADLMYFYTAKEAGAAEVASTQQIEDYDSLKRGFADWPACLAKVKRYNRTSGGTYGKKEDHISEVVQLKADGSRYVFGIPVMNHIQREVSFAVAAPGETDRAAGLAGYSTQDDSKANQQGRDNYYYSTTTPAYAHSYLLTQVLSADYTDVTGNGISDDDIGSFTKFNYSRKETDYRWRAPYDSAKSQYNPGFYSDTKDDKGSVVSGSREAWLLHSIETKNYVAEFYSSERLDALGSRQAISNEGDGVYSGYLVKQGKSYKLDSIKLFNKHDRFLHDSLAAVPIKTVYFEYTNELCPGLPNAVGATGKLTLKKIFFKYGNSEKSMMSPYQFEYGNNKPYNQMGKDRWGNFKPNDGAMKNYEFPYVDQFANNDDYAAAWLLNKVILPSGGTINIAYEADDYAYVQDKRANEMFVVQGIGSNTTFNNANSKLYNAASSPNLYVYFKRRPQMEVQSDFKSNYMPEAGLLAFNFMIDLRNGQFEAVKGYAEIESMGKCEGDTTYGYLKLKYKTPTGSSAKAHPATYAAINLGRYSLKHILYPGQDPNERGIDNILNGLRESLGELLSLGKNPVVIHLDKKRAQTVDINRSCIRLASPGYCKKGGGYRVQRLSFDDSWNDQAHGNTEASSYGKQYEYTVRDAALNRDISSGVASYEPLIGGDENPFRKPVPYRASNGSNWPPNDPVGLYQEEPLGESLFPPAVVGYSSVTISSIHVDKGRSSQTRDVYEFNTAKDFPVQVKKTGIEVLENRETSDFLESKNFFRAGQGYTLLLNDMHGKPKGVFNYVLKLKTGEPELIGYKKYNYATQGNTLNNDLPVFQAGANGTIERVSKLLATEIDATVDTRERKEHTGTDNLSVNVNVSGVFPFILPIPLPYGFGGTYDTEFGSVVSTKVIQQYGILKSVETMNEGAYFRAENEVFDAVTGRPLLVSTNNEYGDLEYNLSLPANWAYKAMGPAYENINFKDNALVIDSSFVTQDTVMLKVNYPELYNIGDELVLTRANGNTVKAWVSGFRRMLVSIDTVNNVEMYRYCCLPYVTPRYHNTAVFNAIAHREDIKVQVVRSGMRNNLESDMEQVKTLNNPVYNNKIDPAYKKVIDIKATTFTDLAVVSDSLAHAATMSVFATGQKGNFRVKAEKVYRAARQDSSMLLRNAGTFDALSHWVPNISAKTFCYSQATKDPDTSSCIGPEWWNARNILTQSVPGNWVTARKVVKWSNYGNELENEDALGIPSTATYGYGGNTPVAVAYNARQGEVMAEGFEEFSMLTLVGNVLDVMPSPFKLMYPAIILSGMTGKWNLQPSGLPQIVTNQSHSGNNALLTGGSDYSLTLQKNSASLPGSNQPLQLVKGREYIVSMWLKPQGGDNNTDINVTGNLVTDSANTAIRKVGNPIEGWQQVEARFRPSASGTTALRLPANYYVDDIRVYPVAANMKAFVYHPFNMRLMATLDENNYATFFEYDQEGNLIRTKRETEIGVMTIREARKENVKRN
jgi:hypothetical protein